MKKSIDELAGGRWENTQIELLQRRTDTRVNEILFQFYVLACARGNERPKWNEIERGKNIIIKNHIFHLSLYSVDAVAKPNASNIINEHFVGNSMA